MKGSIHHNHGRTYGVQKAKLSPLRHSPQGGREKNLSAILDL